MKDNNPQELEITPKATIFGFKKNTLLGIIFIIACIFGAILCYSIFQNPQTQKEEPVQKQQSSSSQPAESLMDFSKVGLGIAIPYIKETTQSEPTFAPSPAPVVPLLSPEALALQQQKAQLEQLKLQQAMQALQSPLNVPLPTTNRQNQLINFENYESQFPQSQKAPVFNDLQQETSDRVDKEDFAQRAVNNEWTLPYQRAEGGKYELKTGTVIPSLMLTEINSDLPGQIIGQVSKNVYDSKTGKHLLIPAGTKLFGVYDSRIAMGQNRVLIAFQRMIFPDGSSITLESMPAADQAGQAGFNDKTNNHYARIFGTSMLMSLISAGMAYSVDTLDTSTGDKTTMQNELTSALAAQLGQTSTQLLQQNMSIKPTLEIRTGYRFNVVLVKDIVFNSPYIAYK